MSYCAIILAAGKGHRYSRTIPKQYTVFDNELIINYSLKIFSEIKPIKKIILVINRLQFTKFKDQVYKSKFEFNILLIIFYELLRNYFSCWKWS